ncbi:hypothetical protein ACIA5D_43615 [Actinoplanes sp. NPDC051513]|uniref:hypothetical protein n=1 Tax=Actinoplanes sp. NPDC051513 TaxID=3363908 RepID=UPI0037A3375D
MEHAGKLVHACRRDGRGGNPTVVLDEAPMTEAERRAMNWPRLQPRSVIGFGLIG